MSDDVQAAAPKINTAILLFGLLSTGLALGLVFLLNSIDMYPMSWYIAYIFPVGALGIGILSGIGYALGSRWAEIRVNMYMIIIIAVVAMVCFVVAHYITYLQLIKAEGLTKDQVSFGQYIKHISETMRFTDEDETYEEGTALGKFGYVFRVLEMLGFALGAIVPVLILKAKAFCEKCQFYMKKTQEVFLFSDTRWKEVKKEKRNQRSTVIGKHVNELKAAGDQILIQLIGKPIEEVKAELEKLSPKPDKKAVCYIQFQLNECPICHDFWIKSPIMAYNFQGQLQYSGQTCMNWPREEKEEVQNDQG